MSAPVPFPQFVYKIVNSGPPFPFPHTLPLSDLDSDDGFIHLSTATQIPTTASLFFASENVLHILKVSSAAVEQEDGRLVWAPTAGCVHLYGKEDGGWGRLGEGTVISVRSAERGADEDWTQAFARLQDWLIDAE